ncbi:MAG: NUDIX hydrolase [Myxococcota bacterium]|nr:NUDIX hydrolase [Myxococcota bacterium]
MLLDPFAALLSSYEPSDARERAFLARMQSLASSAAAFDRNSFVPGHFTASAFVVDPKTHSLLLILHRKLGLWLQPGGHIDPGDDRAERAARREVQEETGIGALSPLFGNPGIFDVDIHTIPAQKSEPGHEHFDVRFAFVADDPALRASDEVAGARWVPLSELPTLTSDESVLRAARKLLSLGA